ncbi:hypothetical protein BDV27DRAFT_147522 [Aspergillus caelatus]|uniref:Tyrosine--tRNA ligase n=1 Tax=Aspergillus caelatus TaxID=61420 RepID=A0A5N6ZWN0_9EURO|nr:uncharacterized protein BDV27DRAFT_147522 [Aspergillus caelatus]KAE8361795.1 hypothetical protein BDV27DRAFT_147522 [Aspergillus caelatus]
MDTHTSAGTSPEVASYYELSWSILSSIGLFTTLLSIWTMIITRPTPLSFIPIIVSAAGAVANGLCYFSFYTSSPTGDRAAASAIADILWLVQEAGLSFYSYQILLHTLRDSTRVLFLSLFWFFMVAIGSIRMAILASRVLEITEEGVSSHSAGPLQHRIDYLHVGYFTTIALVETCSSFFLIRLLHKAYRASPKVSSTRLVFRYMLRTTEMRVASLCIIGITRAVTYSLQATSQTATTVAGQFDRFAYTMECLFPLVMNLAEVLNPELIESILIEKRNPRIYWGTATTGRPHVGYFLAALKIAQLLRAQCDVVVLLADVHAFLDNLKAPLELVENRAKYYSKIITAILESVGVPTDKLEFVLGSSYQKSPEYVMDVYRLSSLISESDAKKAGAEVVKQTENAPLSGLLYPVLQVLDEEHLKVDCQLGGMDQRKLFTAATEWLPKIGYRKRAHLINPMISGLKGAKMSSSVEDSKIDLLDPAESISKKIRKAEAAPKVVEDNGVIALVEYVLLPAAGLKGKKEFRVERRDQEPLVYTDIKQLEEDYRNDVLTPQLLKPAVAQGLIDLMAPIQAAYQASPEWQEITLKAYPPPVVEKKQKKVKDKGTRFPGAKVQQAQTNGVESTEK